MGFIKGDLSVMPLIDLLTWLEHSKKSGSLFLRNNDVEKRIYFDRGNIIFCSSDKDGERLGEFLSNEKNISWDTTIELLKESRLKAVPFTQILIERGILDKASLRNMIFSLSEVMIINSLNWGAGNFEFIDSLPDTVTNGPIRLDTSQIIFNAVKKFQQ